MMCQNFYGQTDSTRIHTPGGFLISQPEKSTRPISMVLSTNIVNNAIGSASTNKNLSSNKIINSNFHDTVGEIEVNGGGQLQFTFPIALPPGIKSVAPQVNLMYTSGSGNGIAGYGWNMSGITTISRIGKNIEKDGEIKGVQLDYSDFYSFNGQRLILKSGEYGKNGAEYVTEKFSNIKIKSFGANQFLQGPEYWEITFEDGSQAWYGATASGNSNARTPVEYNIVKWKDTKGNYITYNYLLANNVAAISSVQWGGNEDLGKSHFNEIVYNYSSRKFKEISYLQGLKFVQSLILNKITVKSNHKIFKEYLIDYTVVDNAATYEAPLSITEKNAIGEEANPVSFTNTAAHYNIVEQSINNINTPNPLFGDFNGDGHLDNLSYSPGYAESEVCIREDINGYCEEYQTFPGMVGGSYITFNKLDNTSAAIKVSDEDLSKGIVTSFLDDNNKIPGRSTITLKQNTLQGMSFKTYVLKEQLMTLVSEKNVPKASYDHTTQDGPPPRTYEPYSTISTTFLKYQEVDVNGDGISEILFSTNDYVCNWDVYNDEGPINKKEGSSIEIGENGRPPVGWGVKCYNYKYTYLHDVLNANTYAISQQSENDILNDVILLDIDGDGIADLVENKNNRITYQKFKKNANDRYTLNWGGAYSFIGEDKGLLFGDFNGDGKTDFMVPYKGELVYDWRVYVNTGKSFEEQIIKNFSEYRPNVYSVNSGYKEQIVINHFSKDVNGDGKDDVIRIESRTYKKHHVGSNRDSELRLKVLVAAGAGYNNQQSFKTAYETITKSTWEQHYYPINLSYRLRNIDQFLIINHGPAYAAFSFYNILQNININQIQQGGILTDVSFIEMNRDDNELQNYYEASNDLTYPYGILKHLPNKFLVKSLNQGQRKQEFRYKDLVFNLKGRGMIGFRQFAKSSWYTDNLKNTKIWSGVEIDPYNGGITLKEWSVKPSSETQNQIFPLDISASNEQLLSSKITEYRHDKLLSGTLINLTDISASDLPKIVSATIPVRSISNDFKKELVSESNIIYDQEDVGPVLIRYYLPTKTTNSINNDFAASSTNLTYIHNKSGIGKDYYIGRLTSKIEKMNVYGDTKESKEEYIYSDNQLETLITYNRNKSGWFQESYAYDGWGNLTKKNINRFKSSAIAKSKGISEIVQYDTNGRFVIKKIDNLGLETLISYNDWGQISEETDPMGVVLKNEYDKWGKMLKSEKSFTGATTYAYTKDISSGDIIMTEYTPNGNEKISYTNKLGQNYILKNRKFGQGEYVSILTLYDELGRKSRYSEPYSGSFPTRWNTIKYDDFSRPIKMVAHTGKIVETNYNGRTITTIESNANNRFKKQTTDPVGNIIITEDLGGTIKFKFNALAEVIEVNYEENLVKTSYDEWGNKIRFEDPSNGIYEYEYNGFMGAISRIISPKGEKTYTYNILGQLEVQKESSKTDRTTDKTVVLTYNNKGLLTGRTGVSMGKSYNSGITYDSYGRMLSAFEFSNDKYFIKKGIVYDNLTRIISYEKELHSSGLITKVSIENEYDTWSGILFRMKEKGTGKILWQLTEENEKGQVTKARLGGVNIDNMYSDDGFLDYIQQESINTSASILFVDYSFNAIKNELISRTTGGDLNIIENFQYDDNNRLYNWTDPVTNVFAQNQQRNIFDNKGRITENDQVGTISFTNAQKQYQPIVLTLNAEGRENYNNDLIQAITYNENNDPFRIDGVRGDVEFEYGLTSMRQRVTYGGNFDKNREGKFTKFYSEDGSYEVVRNNETGEEKHLIYIGGTPYESNIVYVKNYSDKSASFKFLHKDYLGSVLAITDETGTKLEQRHYDAWGNLSHLKIGNNAVITDKNQIRNFLTDGYLILDRGYTSHEHFAEVGLIHMNGRLYDPLLRRFLNADENIQDPHNTQNYNKYGYVLNNPLIYSDPTGEVFFLPFLIGVGLGQFFAGLLSAAIIGAGAGLLSYSLGALTTTSKWKLGAALKSMFFGAVGGAASFGIGSIFTNLEGTATVIAKSLGKFGSPIVQGGVHAISQGTLSLFQGNNIIAGALGGVLGSWAASGFGAAAGNWAGKAGGQIIFGTLAGGAGSVLTGGNFWEGALIGGIVAGLNHVMHEIDFAPQREVLVQHWDARYSDNKWSLNKVSEGYQVLNDPGAGNGYQVVNVYNSAGKVVGTLKGNTALYEFNVATNGNFVNVHNLKIRAQSTVTLGQGVKYSGTALGLASKAILLPTRAGSAPGIFIGEGMWWAGHLIESWGNFQLGNYNKIWQGVLLKGAIKGGPKLWKEGQKQLK